MEILVLLLNCLSFLLVLVSACDYQRIDPGHTMCVHQQRSCVGKTLLRKSEDNFEITIFIIMCIKM